MGITRRKWFRRGRAMTDFTAGMLSALIAPVLQLLFRLASSALRLVCIGTKLLLVRSISHMEKYRAAGQQIRTRRRPQARAVEETETELTCKLPRASRGTTTEATVDSISKGWEFKSPSDEDPPAALEQQPVLDDSCRLEARDVLIQAGYRTREAEAAVAHVLKARPDLNTPEQIVQAALRLRGMRMQPNTGT